MLGDKGVLVDCDSSVGDYNVDAVVELVRGLEKIQLVGVVGGVAVDEVHSFGAVAAIEG